jgi:hypothetical protein
VRDRLLLKLKLQTFLVLAVHRGALPLI